MTHDRIKSSKETVRYNVAFWVKDIDDKVVKLNAALESTSYGSGKTFFAIDAEGLFFTMLVPCDKWGQEMYNIIKARLQVLFRWEQSHWDFRSGVPVIPEQNLSTGSQVIYAN